MTDLVTILTPGIRIGSMPDIGGVTDGSSFVGERAGSGRFLATALRDYLAASFVSDADLATETTARNYLSVKSFGALGDGVTDDTAAINAAFANVAHRTVFFPAGTYMVKDTGTGAGSYCLLNPGVSMLGEGTDRTIIAPMIGTTAGADILKIKPPPGDTDFLSLENFMIYPGATGTPLGARGIYLDCSANCAIGFFHMAGVYCAFGNGYSFEANNDPAINAEGNPFNSVIERCQLWEGVKLGSVGDSVTIRNCVMRGTAGSARSGVLALVVTSVGSGTAAHFVVEKCNMDCPGAAIWILNGRNVKLVHNNIESSYGTGSSSSAVVDIDGTSGAVIMPEVKGNAIGIFGTSTAATAIRVNAAWEADIDNNSIIAGITVAQAVLLTANAQNVHVGFNEISPSFTLPVNNAAVGTRGVRIPLTPGGGFTNVGVGSAPAAYWQAKDGTVTLEGLLACPATPAGLTMATLPAAARPPSNRSFSAYALVAAAVTPQGVAVLATGAVNFAGANTTTQVSLDGITFPTNTGISGGL